jgi:predicted PilT family ATPase
MASIHKIMAKIDTSLMQEAELEEFERSIVTTSELKDGLFIGIDSEDLDLVQIPARKVIEMGLAINPKSGDKEMRVTYDDGDANREVFLMGGYIFIGED